MDLISSAPNILVELINITKLLTAKSRSTNIHRRLIIRELRDNLKKFESAFKYRLSIDLLIDNISNSEILKAIDNNFNFKKLKKGIVHDNLIKEPRNRKYIGWSAEELLDKIDEKTEELKNIKRLNNGTVASLSDANINLKLTNHFFRMMLLARLINE